MVHNGRNLNFYNAALKSKAHLMALEDPIFAQMTLPFVLEISASESRYKLQCSMNFYSYKEFGSLKADRKFD